LLTQSHCTIDDIEFSFGKGKKNGPPLLLLHGLTFRWQLFESLISSFEPDWQVYALDFRGHGGSARSRSGDYEYDQLVNDTAAFIESEIGKNTVLIGYSLGGAVAAKVAGQLPNLVRAVVIIDNFLFWDSLQAVRTDPLISTMFRSIQALVRQTRSPKDLAGSISDISVPLPEAGQRIRLSELFPPAFIARWAESVAEIDPGVISVLLGEVPPENFDGEAILKAIACPLLLLQANPALGGLLPDRDVERARAIQPATQHIKFDQLGHMMYLQDPTAVSSAIVSFLETVS